MYHRITDIVDEQGVNRDVFEQQMDYIRTNMNPVSLSEIAECLSLGKPIPPKAVAITFDDGYEDNYTNAYPVLKKYEIPATIFLTAGYIGTSKVFWWDKLNELINKTRKNNIELSVFFESFKDVNRINSARSITLNTEAERKNAKKLIADMFKTYKNEEINKATNILQSQLNVLDETIKTPQLLNWAQVKEMNVNGVEFGAHTMSHPILSQLSVEESENEVILSKRTIENEIGIDVKGFAIPYGLAAHFNNGTLKTIEQTGFRYCCSAESGFVTCASNAYSLKRISMSNSFSSSVYKISKCMS
jgi:peptidoglycan/xylan/chitin deacetylase (PgdA/CDA1 family)